MKFINNFINQLTPFFFYAIGGLLVIAGDLSIGALVAAISAYKDLTSPWKELLSFYQRLQDATLKYLQIYEQFHPQGMMQWIPSTPTSPIDLKASYKVERLGISNDFGERILQNINFEVKAGRCIAIEVANPIQQSRLAMTLANILPASMGRIIIGDNDIKSLGSELLGKKLSFINPEPHIFAESILQNINYGLRYRVPEEDPEQLTQARKYDIKESIASGNSPDSVDDIWIDFSLVGVTGWEDYRLWWSQVAKAVGADTVLYQRGLDEVFSPLERPYLMQHLLPSRDRITQELAQQGLAVFVSRLDEDTYDLNACIMQNLFFGKLTDTSLNYWLVAQNIELQDRLRDSELWPRAMITGAKMAELVLAMIAQPEDDQTLIDDFINVSQASLDALRQLKDVDLTLTQELSHQQQGLLLSLFLGTIPTVHGENLITDDVQCAVLSLRRQFKLDMPVLMRDKIERFNPEKYHSRLSIWRNLLFGELSHNAAPDAKEQVLGVVTDVLEAMNIKEYVMVALGLSDTGIGGARLPPLAKHRIAYSRAIIKKPDIIIAQEPLPILDLDERLNILRRTRKLLPEASMILINSKVPDDPMFDQIYTIEDGSLKERGGLRTTTPVKTAVINDTLQPLALELNVLSNCPIFSDLSGQQIKNLAINGQFLDVPAEGYLYRRGAAVEGAYILVSGQALVLQHTANGDLPTVAITENELFGEVELIAETSRFHGVKAISHMKVFCLEGISFHLLLEANPELYTRIFKAISQRLNGNIYQAKADSDVDMA
jgi:putative ABC transport system ATP-binding protein